MANAKKRVVWMPMIAGLIKLVRNTGDISGIRAKLVYRGERVEVTDADGSDIQLRTAYELFHKENILNRVIQSFPPDWQYGSWIDEDFHFTRHDWALETIHQLQHYDFVQLFSSIVDLDGLAVRGEGHRPLGRERKSFVRNYFDNDFTIPRGYAQGGWLSYYNGGPGDVGAPGGAWAFRRSAFDVVGGFLDKCILGSGDWFMAFGLIGDPGSFPFCSKYTPDYSAAIAAWQERAALLRRNVGYVDGHVIHHFHGRKSDRAYGTRDKILVDNAYAPTTDVFYDWQGVLQLAPHRVRLRDQIRRYFLSRSEDLPSQ
jgi:prepilin-type processing-associated H-X9-DG protein